MDDRKINKGILLLGFILMLMSLLLAVLLQWIKDEHFLRLESIISYKRMSLVLLIIIFILVYAPVYARIFGISNPKKEIEKICPSCDKPKLKLIRSTIRSFTYKCSACGFDHKELKEGRSNVSRI